MTTAQWTPEQFPELLTRLCRGECHDNEVLRWVNLCVEMASVYLTRLHHKILKSG